MVGVADQAAGVVAVLGEQAEEVEGDLAVAAGDEDIHRPRRYPGRRGSCQPSGIATAPLGGSFRHDGGVAPPAGVVRARAQAAARRQGADWGMGPRAASKKTKKAGRADRRPEGHRVDLPLLRGRLRPGRLHARRRARRHRGQPALADQPGHAVPEGLGLAPARPAARPPDEGQVPAPRRDRVGGARARDGDGHDRRAHDRRARERLAGHRRRGPARGPHDGLRAPRRRDARQRGELPDQEGFTAMGAIQIENQARI